MLTYDHTPQGLCWLPLHSLHGRLPVLRQREGPEPPTDPWVQVWGQKTLCIQEVMVEVLSRMCLNTAGDCGIQAVGQPPRAEGKGRKAGIGNISDFWKWSQVTLLWSQAVAGAARGAWSWPSSSLTQGSHGRSHLCYPSCLFFLLPRAWGMMCPGIHVPWALCVSPREHVSIPF